MAEQNSYITGFRVERQATIAADAQRRSDQALLGRCHQAALRTIDGDQAAQRNLEIRDFVTGRSGQHWPMATRNPPRYNLIGIGIGISIALIVVSILSAIWLATS